MSTLKTINLKHPDGTANTIQMNTSSDLIINGAGSGDLLVGKSSTTFSDVGAVIRSTGSATITRDGNDPLALNRKSSDGEILGFYKDGTLVGSIGVTTGRIYIGSGDTALYFNEGTDAIQTVTAAGVTRSDAIDLGDEYHRFKDLHLSGGVVFGDAGGSGTPSSNTLDSYEEGLHTPIIYGSTTGTGTPLPIRSTYDKLAYTKIGRLVTVQGKLETLGSHSATGALQVTLPFTAANLDDSAGIGAGTVLFYRTGQLHTNPVGIVGEGNSAVSFYENSGTGDIETILAQDMDNAIEFFFSVTYMTT